MSLHAVFPSFQTDTVYGRLEPERLVMTRTVCFYCGADHTKMALVHYNFGMKTCDAHHSRGIRDCNAYMHREGLVKTKQAVKHAALSRLFTYLDGGIPIVRSNGEVQEDWVLNMQDGIDTTFIVRSLTSTDDWLLPMKWVSPNGYADDLVKHVDLNYFLDAKFFGDRLDNTIIRDALDLLNKGIYLNDHYEYQLCPSLSVITEEEDPIPQAAANAAAVGGSTDPDGTSDALN